MDPDTCIAEMVVLSERILRDTDESCDASHDAAELAERFQAINHWLEAKGFLPAKWAR